MQQESRIGGTIRRVITRAALSLGGLTLVCLSVAAGCTLVLVRRTVEQLPTPQAIRARSLVSDIILQDRSGAVLHSERTGSSHRIVVPFGGISPHLRDAAVAVEDERFWTRSGIDYEAILRAGASTVLRGQPQGGSTIPQQLLKLTLLGGLPVEIRKVSELLLVRRYEELLTREELLELYLNASFFGSGNAGVEAASRDYFGKSARDVTVAEAALLIGMLQAPAHTSPYCNPNRARQRQEVALRRMRQVGMLTDVVVPTVALRLADDTADWRAPLIEVALHAGSWVAGDSVTTSFDRTIQEAAVRALRNRLEQYTRERGEHRGPRLTLTESTRDVWRHALTALHATVRDWRGDADSALVYDLRSLEHAPRPERLCQYGGTIFRQAVPGGYVSGIVLESDPKHATLDLGDYTATLDAKDTDWTRVPLTSVAPVGAMLDLLLPEKLPPRGGSVAVTIIPRPIVDGAVVVLDPRTREVRALVGGISYRRGAFHRAFMARRQVGSTMKPFIFAAAIGTAAFGVFDAVADVPIRYRDPWSGTVWEPSNWYEGHVTDLLAYQALAHSVNTVAVQAALMVGVDRIRTFLAHVSPITAIPREPAVALGAFERTPIEVANAYATIASGGRGGALHMVASITRDGTTQEVVYPGTAQVLDPDLVRTVDWLLRQVVHDASGTARSLDVVGLGVRGKTGTTNDARDAWFVGYTPELLVTTWVGYDEPRSLRHGSREEGGSSLAAPIAAAVFRAAADAGLVSAADEPTLALEHVALFGVDAPAITRERFDRGMP